MVKVTYIELNLRGEGGGEGCWVSVRARGKILDGHAGPNQRQQEQHRRPRHVVLWGWYYSSYYGFLVFSLLRSVVRLQYVRPSASIPVHPAGPHPHHRPHQGPPPLLEPLPIVHSAHSPTTVPMSIHPSSSVFLRPCRHCGQAEADRYTQGETLG